MAKKSREKENGSYAVVRTRADRVSVRMLRPQEKVHVRLQGKLAIREKLALTGPMPQ